MDVVGSEQTWGTSRGHSHYYGLVDTAGGATRKSLLFCLIQQGAVTGTITLNHLRFLADYD